MDMPRETPSGKSDTAKVSRPTVLQPGTHTWVPVVTRSRGSVFLEPLEKLYQKRGSVAANGIATVEPGRQFKILVGNVSTRPVHLVKGQVIATVRPHPSSVFDTPFTLMDVLAVTGTDDDGKPSEEAKTVKSLKRVARENKQEYLEKSVKDLREKKARPPKEEELMTAEDVDLSGVDKRWHARIRSMLDRHAAMWSGKLGEITITEHAIDLKPDARPVAVPPYRAGPKTRELEQAEVDRQLRDGVIEPAQSEWASPVVFAPKADGTLRFCVDYRRLNLATIKDSYPIPRMDECIDSLGEARIFSTLDCNAGYWQIPVRPGDRDKTTFTCHAGTYRYVRMPFGLTNAPATFQRTLDILLSQFKWKHCLVYLDDVIIHSRDVESHIGHVDAILTTLRKAGVSLKLRKCSFFTKTVRYLGHVIQPGTLAIDDTSTASLKGARAPATQSEIRSFLGMCNVYRRFIKDFSHIAEPLNALLRAGQPETIATWGEKEEQAFRSLVEAICAPPILRLPRRNLPFTVDTDASDYQVGCVLFQDDEAGKRHPIGFWSRTLQGAERNYSAPEKECLAVVWALQTLRPYLAFEKFTVYTDHAALRWLLNIAEPSGRLARWRLRLSEFDFDIQYKKGRVNTQADALSRLRTDAETAFDPEADAVPVYLAEAIRAVEEDETTGNDTRPSAEVEFLSEEWAEHDAMLVNENASAKPVQVTPITWHELLTEQLSDDFCSRIRSRVNAGERIPFNEDGRGYLVRTVCNPPQLVLPQSLRARLLHAAHHGRLAGHPGGRKLYYVLRRHFYWPSMALDAYNVVKNCVTCARNRIKLRRHASPLKLFPARAPLEYVAIDILGELVKTPRGNRYLLVMTDRYSKLTKTVPLRRITTNVIAHAFITHWVLNYGPPTYVLSDNGKQFTAKFFMDVCRIVGTKNYFTTTYHPQANGQVERFNSTLVQAMRHFIADHPRDWDLYSDAVTYAYNTQPHSSTHVAPFELVLSNPPGPPGLLPDPLKRELPPAEFRYEWKQWLSHLMNSADDALRDAQQRYKRNFDNRVRPLSQALRPNAYAFLRADRPQSDNDGFHHKLAPLVTGPHRITEVADDGRTLVLDLGTRASPALERVSRDRVVPAPQPPTSTWTPQDAHASQSLNPLTWPAPAGFNLSSLPRSRDASLGVSLRVTPPTSLLTPTPVPSSTQGNTAAPAADTTTQGGTPVVDTTPLRDGQHQAATAMVDPSREDFGNSSPSSSEKDTSAHAGDRPSDDEHPDSPTAPTGRPGISPSASADISSSDFAQAMADATQAAASSVASPEALPPAVSAPLPSASARPPQCPREPTPLHRSREYVLNRIVSHEVADGTEPEYPAGITLYRVRWYGFGPWDDTWEPIHHLPRSHVQRYYKKKKLPLPPDIDKALQG
jgi:transposase InsO family protein